LYSGHLGPKREEGDSQIPEGFYKIALFNPKSKYHLSMMIDYPNKSDRILGIKGNLGGDIFIHGEAASIGCIPIGTPAIKGLYIICFDSYDAGNDIPVHIFPCRFSEQSCTKALEDYISMNCTENDTTLRTFWDNLKTGFEFFDSLKTLPKISVDKNGKYIFKR